VRRKVRRRPAAATVAVAHVGPDVAAGGGIASVILELTATDVAGRHPTTVIRTHRYVGATGRLVEFLRGLAALAVFCLRPGPRVVHVHMTVRGSMYRKSVCVALARALRTPVLLHVHGGALELARFHARLHPLSRRAVAAAMRLATRVVTVSEAGAAVLEERYRAPRVDVVPNPAPRLAPAAGAVADACDVLFLGGFFNPIKGGAELVRALPALLRRRPAARVSLAGPGAPPPELERLCAAEPGLRWLGWLDADAKAAAVAATRIVVLPSLSEGLPVVLLEAMACGRAIVATQVGGIPEVLEDGRTGVLVAAGDPEALADALADLLDRPEFAAALGRAAAERAAEFDPERVGALMDDLYRVMVPV
jgi:glycosyltransferase involved in cell wall biosynthesis